MLRSLIVLLTLLFTPMAFSQSGESSDEPEVHQSGVSAGMLYYRDPETGELTTPPPEVARELQPDAKKYSTEGLEMVRMSDGTIMVDLQGRFQMTTVMKTDAEGNAVQYCTAHPDRINDAEHAASHAAPAER